MEKELNRLIDHTILKPEATTAEIEKLCNEAKEHHFASVCINPCYIPVAKKILQGSDVKVCTVIGFPLGAMLKESKVHETEDCIKAGAEEIDMVINVGKLKEKDYSYVEQEIREIKEACQGHILKVIIECCLLTDEEIVKASTGFSKWGAKAEDVKLMAQTVAPELGVKAAGGIKNREDALKMVENGATRLGTSHGLDIVK